MKTTLSLPRSILCLLVLTSQFALAQVEERKPGGPRLPPQPGPVSCPAPERHRETDFGSHFSVGAAGRSGRDGVNGTDGRSGQDINIVASGAALQFNLRGADGSDASDGLDGEHASCLLRDPFRDRINQNIQQPDGGGGGDAGRPGSGGSGGDATIYFTDLKQLKQIYIDATPGIGGESARAGRGGRGCFCNVQSWETGSFQDFTRIVGDVKLTCSEPVQTIHSCRNGSDGSDGSSRSASDGSIGAITLIKSAQPLPQNVTSASLEITQAAVTQVNLLRNIFETRSGAIALLANGSIISDRYSAYVRTASLPAQLVWKARLPISDFAGSRVSYSMSSDGLSADINVSSGWIVGHSELINGKQIYTVDRALLEKDAARLSAVISGNGKNTILTITDEAEVTDLIDQVNISLNMDSKGVFSHDRYDGAVPANNIKVEGNKYVINIYDLWVLKNSQKQADGDLKKGKVVKVELSVTRSMAGRSADFDLNFEKIKLTDGDAIKD